MIDAVRADALLKFGSSYRLPMILQTEMAECGLACLGMIVGYYGYDTDIMNLRRRYSISSKGVNLKNIMNMAAGLHLAPRALRIEPEHLNHVQLPCIAHWGLNHFVVLKAVKKNKMVVHDPALGVRHLDKEEFNKEFTGVILELSPTKEFELGEEKQLLKLSDFWSRIVGLKRNLTQVLMLSLMLQLFALMAPFYMQIVVDYVIPSRGESFLIALALGFFLLMIVQIATNTLREFVILHIANRLSMQMSSNLFRHLIRLPIEYFEKRHMGDIVSRFGSLGHVRNLLTYSIVAAIIDGVMAVITLIAMFLYSSQLSFIVLGVVALYGVFRWVFFRPFKMLTEERIIAGAKENSHFMESIRAIQTIKIFQRENDRQAQWLNSLAAVINRDIRIANWGIGYGVINSFLFGLGSILIIYFAAISVIEGVLSLGMVYAFMSFQGRFVSAMDSLISKWVDLKMLDVHLGRLADIAFTPSENIDRHSIIDKQNVLGEDSYSLQKIAGKIEVRDLSYRYSEHEPNVFKNISFTVQPGESVAITGPSGCGKTTILKCLMGLLKPTEGEILIDDIPLKNILHYRSQIAGVMQEDQLLNGDMAENISCFSTELQMDEVHKSARMACIHDDVLKMPMQYNTLVGDMGSSLSGGQKQRIVLARALYSQPRILFMDEATSHLDLGNESVINDNVKSLDITRITVAHRGETINSADRIINMNLQF
ncbi:peptidase domain-containing ABC transporter [Teredinibacter haidensis]|uniref:peptidase domain-containing ABC transporter n=1 Tax=Teredinibacter haidensis TaxID=2731755 RepID=UPI000948F516|nr:peptidase domain-containing ABC transporter [Teredinibacter haidensis]